MIAFTRAGRRRKALDEPFADEWRDLLDQTMAHWSMLDDDERALLEDYIRMFLVDKKWQAANGFELTESIRVQISAMACLLLLGLDFDCYENVRWIEVHPSTVVRLGIRGVGVSGVVTEDPFPVLGEAHFSGPVVIAWDEALANARHPERGHNVVYHEFAHKLDMDDGTVDGTPLQPDVASHQLWVEVCTAAYEDLRDGRGGELLDAYGGVNPGEFFAVATEVFFDRPLQMRQQKPDLYQVLSAFYRQDPAEREHSSKRRR